MQPKKLKNGQLSFSAINLGLVQSEVINLIAVTSAAFLYLDEIIVI